MTEKPQPRKYLLCTGKIVPYEKIHEHPGAHVMGHIGYAVSYGHSVTVFKRWRKSVPTDEVPPIEPECEVVVGDVRGMFCRHEGCVRRQDWYIARSSAVALFVERYGFDEAALNEIHQEKADLREVKREAV